ncbi:MAG: hypothetical protein AB7P02_10015 [Alphaproteobacteria bacterium]
MKLAAMTPRSESHPAARGNRGRGLSEAPTAPLAPPRTTGADDGLVQAFVARGARALTDIARTMPRERLIAVLAAPTDTDLLMGSLQASAEAAPARDPLTAALLRGAERKRALLQAEGGVLSAAELARHLGITTQGLGKKRDRGQVFWLPMGEGYVYPAFQVDGAGLLPGIRAVLDAFVEADPWMRIQFMLTGDRRLGGRRPLDALRAGDTAGAAAAAAAFGEHGAA